MEMLRVTRQACMKRGSKYWRFCLVRSFCINQPQVSYYPRWHAGSGTRRGGTLRKKHYSKHLNCIVLSSKTIIIKADHFQALALNPSPFSNPKSQSPPPGKGAVCGCVQRRSWSSSHARGPRLIIQWHSSPPTHKTSNSVTHKGGVPTKSLKDWGPVLSFFQTLQNTFSQGTMVFSWFHLLYLSILVLYILFVLFLFIHFPILS